MADITGTPGVDSLFGSLSADAIVALEGDDVAFGSDGDDIIFGNSGNDALAGNQGNDTINSGRDNDVILSGQGDDISQGDDGNDWVFGNLGSDTLFGNIGDDSMFGGQGNDVIFGGQGNDVISGDFGNDVISGDRGTDSLSGGAGNDIFVLTKRGGGATPADADVILDFREGDRLGLAPGLALAAINIQFVAGSNGVGDAIIRDLSDNTGSYLAIVKNVPSTLITGEIFTTNLTPLTDDDSGGGDGGDGGGGGGSIEPTPPLARILNLNIGEDSPITTQFDASDANNDPLTFSIVEAPTNGTASLFGLPNGFFSYTPGANFSGSDSFTYQVNDGTELSNVATVNINIFPLEDVPIATAKTVAVDFTKPSPITLTGADGDGDPLSFRILSLPEKSTGSLFQTTDGTTLGAEITESNTVIPSGIVIFVPTPGATAPSSFGYVANDGKADSAGATITLNLGNVAPNSAPGIDLNGDTVEGLDFRTIFTPGGGAVSIVDPANLNVGDADNNNIASATVRITNAPDGANEILAADPALAATNGITINNTVPGTLTLTGFASPTAYAAVLRTLTYNNISPTPTRTIRTMTFTVNDGKENSVSAISTVDYPLALVGDANNNTLVGGLADDTLTGADGADLLTGGGGADVFVYQNRNDGSPNRFRATSNNVVMNRIAAQDYDTIVDFVSGTDKIKLEADVTNVTGFNNILPTVQTTIPDNTNILVGNERMFAYETGGSTYLIYDEDGNNIQTNDTRILVKLQGVSGLGTLASTDFLFM